MSAARARLRAASPATSPGASRRSRPRPGVGQILAAEGRSLVIGGAVEPAALGGVAARAREEAAPAGGGRRPDLSASPTAIGWIEATAPSGSGSLYERLMAPLVPLASPPRPQAARLPSPRSRRALPARHARGRGRRTGRPLRPFPRPARGREGARRSPQALFPLRPCDYSFEPDPALPARPRVPLRPGAHLRGPVPRARERGRVPQPRAAGGRVALEPAGPRREAELAVPATAARPPAPRGRSCVDAGRQAIGLFPVRAGRGARGRGAQRRAGRARSGRRPARVARGRGRRTTGRGSWPGCAARAAAGRTCWSRDGPRTAPQLAARVRAGLPERFGGNFRAPRGEALKEYSPSGGRRSSSPAAARPAPTTRVSCGPSTRAGSRSTSSSARASGHRGGVRRGDGRRQALRARWLLGATCAGPRSIACGPPLRLALGAPRRVARRSSCCPSCSASRSASSFRWS